MDRFLSMIVRTLFPGYARDLETVGLTRKKVPSTPVSSTVGLQMSNVACVQIRTWDDGKATLSTYF